MFSWKLLPTHVVATFTLLVFPLARWESLRRKWLSWQFYDYLMGVEEEVCDMILSSLYIRWRRLVSSYLAVPMDGYQVLFFLKSISSLHMCYYGDVLWVAGNQKRGRITETAVVYVADPHEAVGILFTIRCSPVHSHTAMQAIPLFRKR